MKLAIRGPPLVAVIAPPRKKLVTFSVTPAVRFVLRSPPMKALSLIGSIAVCVILTEAAVRAAVAIALQLETVKAPILVAPPIAPPTVIEPVPAVIPKVWAPADVPSMVLEKRIFALVELSKRFPLKNTGLAIEIPVAVRDPPILTNPDPACVNAPPTANVEPLGIVSGLALVNVIVTGPLPVVGPTVHWYFL